MAKMWSKQRCYGFFSGIAFVVQNCGVKPILNSLLKLVFSAVVYHIWKMRNPAIFHNLHGDKEVVLRTILEYIWTCLFTWKSVKDYGCNA